MTFWEIVGWVLVFFTGAYAGSVYEMRRVIAATESGKFLTYRGKAYKVYETSPPR